MLGIKNKGIVPSSACYLYKIFLPKSYKTIRRLSSIVIVCVRHAPPIWSNMLSSGGCHDHRYRAYGECLRPREGKVLVSKSCRTEASKEE